LDNPYLRSYSTLANRLLQINDTSEMSVWPTAFPISQDDSVTSFQQNDVVVPNFDFTEEVQVSFVPVMAMIFPYIEGFSHTPVHTLTFTSLILK